MRHDHVLKQRSLTNARPLAPTLPPALPDVPQPDPPHRGRLLARWLASTFVVGAVVGGAVELVWRARRPDADTRADAAALVAVLVAVVSTGMFALTWLSAEGQKVFAPVRKGGRDGLVVLLGIAVGYTALTLLLPPAAATVACRQEDGMTVLELQGTECIGFTDRADGGTGKDFSFNDSYSKIRDAQHEALANNSTDDDATTLVWMGALSCKAPGSDAERCDDKRRYQSESEELKALRDLEIAQNDGHHTPVHIVIANAGQDVYHAERVAHLLVTHRADLGAKVAVAGLGDSRAVTRRAVEELLDNGIPVVSPTMTADDAKGDDFVPRPGFVQLATGNSSLVESLFTMAESVKPAGTRPAVLLYTDTSTPHFTDLTNDFYVKSFREAATRVFGTAHGWTMTEARSPAELETKASAFCRHGSTRAGAVLFADRWPHFEDFANSLTAACSTGRPELVLADGSAGRFMISDGDRGALRVPGWPMLFLGAGLQCHELRPPPGSAAPPPGAQRLLDAEQTRPGGGSCSTPGVNDIASHTTAMWDAGLTALALLASVDAQPTDRAQAAAFLGGLHVSGLELAEGMLTVEKGRRSGKPLIPALVQCVADVLAGPRGPVNQACRDAFHGTGASAADPAPTPSRTRPHRPTPTHPTPDLGQPDPASDPNQPDPNSVPQGNGQNGAPPPDPNNPQDGGNGQNGGPSGGQGGSQGQGQG
jgi:hypothetical protein